MPDQKINALYGFYQSIPLILAVLLLLHTACGTVYLQLLVSAELNNRSILFRENHSFTAMEITFWHFINLKRSV